MTILTPANFDPTSISKANTASILETKEHKELQDEQQRFKYENLQRE